MRSPREVWRRIVGRLSGDFSDETVEVEGRTFRLRRGSFRATPDYDDAWFLACAVRATGVLDIGANVGYDALLALAFSKAEYVALVEANPRALSIAAHNLIDNGLSGRARFFPAFASDRADQRVLFWTTGSGAAGSVFPDHARTASARGDSMEVPTITVDAICDTLQPPPDFVKIDVEGAEALVLAGSRRLAARREACFLVEMHSNAELAMADNAASILAWCDDLGYAAWYLKDHARLVSVGQIGSRGRCHLLLQPGDRPFPAWLGSIEQSAELHAALPARSD